MRKSFSLCIIIAILCTVLLPATSIAAGVPEEVLSNTSSVFYIESWSGLQGSSGTAFLIHTTDDASLLLTNEHVIHINKNYVTVFINEYIKCQATVIAASEQYDLAVLQVSASLGKDLQLSKNVKQGDAVYAVGFPGDADYLSDSHAVVSSQATITDGIVSAIRTMKIVEYGPSITILQTNADINYGNSGGPLFNSLGHVVGVNTYGVSSASGIYGAISMESVLSFLKDNNLFSIVSVSSEETVTTAEITQEVDKPQETAKEDGRMDDLDPANLTDEDRYQKAVMLDNNGDYDAAIEWFESIQGYKDSADRINGAKYHKAAALANRGDYDAAVRLYESIKEYKDSKELIDSTKYRKGYFYLTSQQYSEAEEVFASLKRAGYEPAMEALDETYYSWGMDYIDKKDYVNAYTTLNKCKNHQDASEIIDALQSIIYSEGIEKYQAGKYSEAKKRFNAIFKYGRSNDYLFLISCHQSKASLSENTINKLTNLIGFEDAGALIFKDDSAFYFMTGGTWYGDNGYMRFYEINQNEQSYWAFATDMSFPEKKWKFVNNIFRMGDVDCFYIAATRKDTIVVEYIKTGKQYTMTRR